MTTLSVVYVRYKYLQWGAVQKALLSSGSSGAETRSSSSSDTAAAAAGGEETWSSELLSSPCCCTNRLESFVSEPFAEVKGDLDAPLTCCLLLNRFSSTSSALANSRLLCNEKVESTDSWRRWLVSWTSRGSTGDVISCELASDLSVASSSSSVHNPSAKNVSAFYLHGSPAQIEEVTGLYVQDGGSVRRFYGPTCKQNCWSTHKIHQSITRIMHHRSHHEFLLQDLRETQIWSKKSKLNWTLIWAKNVNLRKLCFRTCWSNGSTYLETGILLQTYLNVVNTLYLVFDVI